jgi:hypothetical protein
MRGDPNVWDDIVLGARSADGVVAARLSDCVEFVEARKDAPDAHETVERSLDWSWRATDTIAPLKVKSVCSRQIVVLRM